MDDLILRRQAIDAFNTNLNELVVGGEENAKTVENYLNRVLDKIKCLPSALGTNLAEVGTDTISRQQAIGALRDYLVGKNVPCDGTMTCRLIENEVINKLPSAEPEHTCVNCGRTVNNGGWYADGGTRCPIEEHYALPKDGYCHLWEKRNITDDDYPERRTDE